MKAIWNNAIIAESDDIVSVEGNSYFPIESVKKEFLRSSQTHSVCPWKGNASYYDLERSTRMLPGITLSQKMLPGT